MTTLTNPYDDLPRDQRQRVQALVSKALCRILFQTYLIERGVQDRIIAQLLTIFSDAIKKHPNIQPITPDATDRLIQDNERHARNILRRFSDCQFDSHISGTYESRPAKTTHQQSTPSPY